MTRKKLTRYGLLICLTSVLLGTISLMGGNWYLWGINCGIFGAAAACTVVNIVGSRE